MSTWTIIIGCWIVGSFPFAVLVGNVLAVGQRPSPMCAPDDLSAEVDAFLDRLFAA